MKKLYCVDFDGTITTKDTMFLFLKFYHPIRFYLQFALHSLPFVFVKFRLMDAGKVKESFIASILKNEKQVVLEGAAIRFYAHYSSKIVRNTAREFFLELSKDSVVYLVTASLDIWVRPFAEGLNMQYIATEAKFSDGVFTGRFATKNCNGKEKVERILQKLDVSTFDKTIAFGDTKGDKPMLEWADESYFRFFH